MHIGIQTNAQWSPADFGLIRPRLDEPAQFTSAKLGRPPSVLITDVIDVIARHAVFNS